MNSTTSMPRIMMSLPQSMLESMPKSDSSRLMKRRNVTTPLKNVRAMNLSLKRNMCVVILMMNKMMKRSKNRLHQLCLSYLHLNITLKLTRREIRLRIQNRRIRRKTHKKITYKNVKKSNKYGDSSPNDKDCIQGNKSHEEKGKM